MRHGNPQYRRTHGKPVAVAKRPYTGNKDGAAKAKRAGTEWFVRAMRARWKFRNMGTLVIRDMRGKPGVLSVHATGRAADIGYLVKDRKKAVEIVEWLATNADALGIEAIHDYVYGDHGRGWRCDRGKWKTYTAADNAGSGGYWFHIELNPKIADDAGALSDAWHTIPKPDKA